MSKNQYVSFEEQVITELIGERNEWLFMMVSESFPQIHIKPATTQFSSMLIEGERATICLPESNPTEEALTHELLHLYLFSQETVATYVISSSIKQSPLLNKILPLDYLERIINVIEHPKMLPIYLKMGYSQANFLHDSHLCKCELSKANMIAHRFKVMYMFKREAITSYIGYYFAMKSDISDIDYTAQLAIFKELDRELYAILETFWSEWLNFDIENTNPIRFFQNNFAADFVRDLENWTQDKFIL